MAVRRPRREPRRFYARAVGLRPTSLRSRLAVLFAIGSGALLLVSGAFLYVNLNNQLHAAIDEGLRARADDISAAIDSGSRTVPKEEAFAALLTPSGEVVDASAAIDRLRPVLRPDELETVRHHDVVVDRTRVPGLGRRARLLARTETAAGVPNTIVVVGASLDAVIRAQQRLGLVLGALSPLLIAALAGGGWIVTAAALRPVGDMTSEAEAITLSRVGRRLPQPPGDDELAHLGRTLNNMLDRIEAAVAHERSFLDDASHELRTPISILRAELELALGQPGDSTEVHQALHSSLEEVERLAQLTEDLLVLARADSDQVPLRAEPVDLRASADHVAERLRDEGPKIAVEGSRVVVHADPLWIEQIVTNLVANAKRFARSQVRIDVNGASHGVVQVAVADDGPGFPPEALPTIFDRFSRAGRSGPREGGGAGLGLAIVAALVRAHGGTLEATNGPPLGGARVAISLPVDTLARSAKT